MKEDQISLSHQTENKGNNNFNKYDYEKVYISPHSTVYNNSFS